MTMTHGYLIQRAVVLLRLWRYISHLLTYFYPCAKFHCECEPITETGAALQIQDRSRLSTNH